jgi:signal transduction histidine kinase
MPKQGVSVQRARPHFWPLWIAAIALPMLILAGLAVLAWERKHTAARALLHTDIALLHEHALRTFETQAALLAAVQWRTRGMSWEEISASADLAAMMRHLAEEAPGTSHVGIARPDGRLTHITSAPFPPPPEDLSDCDYVRHQQGPDAGPFVSASLIGRMSGHIGFNYSHPRRDGAGRPDGGLFWTTIRQEEFNSFYEGLLRGTRDEIALLRSPDATILASHPPPAPPPADGQAQPGDTAGFGETVRAALAAPGQTVLGRGISPLDGETRLYAAQALGRVPAVVVKGLHPATLRAGWREEVISLAVMALATNLVLLWLTWWVRNSARREALALAQGRAAAEGRAEAETALRQTQRLQVLGEVVAGVSHDFRNTVQAVQGGAVLARKAIEAGDTERTVMLLGMMSQAAGRGAALTERMLRVARRDGGVDGRPATLDPAAALTAASDLLVRTLPAGYPVVLDIRAPGLPAQVLGDPAEFEAALLNLALNARDAMPEGGVISIRLEADLPASAGGDRPPELAREVRHARIVVADTGVGMDAATLTRVAEPFFTTKPPGKGTGLGLASVRAFARSACGAFRITSPGPGCGATATIWLPEAPP